MHFGADRLAAGLHHRAADQSTQRSGIEAGGRQCRFAQAPFGHRRSALLLSPCTGVAQGIAGAKTQHRSYDRTPSRRDLFAGVLGAALLGSLAACGSSAATSSSASSTGTAAAAPSSPSPSPSPATATAVPVSDDTPALTSLAAVKNAFKQYTYSDATTGKTVPYNLFVPADYDSNKSYPLVLYIADSSLVGQAVTAPLSQYGALIWASDLEQAKHASFVLVPEFPEIIIDDNNGRTVTDYVELTARMVSSVAAKYNVDSKRIYGTGQSMGCMTVLYLAAQHPTLFAAEYFVSGQWDISVLSGLKQEKFFYIAAGGDAKASAGQTEVQQMLSKAGIPYKTTTLDATWTAEKIGTTVRTVLATDDTINFATFKTGTVLTAGGTSAGGGPGGSGEHMASFQPAYEITAVRDWLFQQSA